VDAQSPRDANDLSGIERTMAGWQPSTAGLDTDAMLFAAGQAAAAGRRGRYLWPALCAFLAIQTTGLAIWGLREHSEREVLARRLGDHTPAAQVPPADVVASYSPSPNDYIHLRQRAEHDQRLWLAAEHAEAAGGPGLDPAILRAGERERLLAH
jgi:hypothetical protein